MIGGCSGLEMNLCRNIFLFAASSCVQDVFLAAAMNRSLLERKDLLESAFRHFDRDGDGFIDHDELVEVRAIHFRVFES